MSTLIHQLDTARGSRVGRCLEHLRGSCASGRWQSAYTSKVEDRCDFADIDPEEVPFDASPLPAEDEEDDVDLYYFSSDSDESWSLVHDDAEAFAEDEEEIMPGGWPIAQASEILAPSRLPSTRPQSFMADDVRITVTMAEEEEDHEDRPCLRESDSAASFFTAAESLMEDMHLLSPSPTRDFLDVPAPTMAPSPSVLIILEEFSCSPPLPSSAFEDNGAENLWGLPASPSSTGLLTPPENGFLGANLVSTPEFASNFTQARFPEFVCRSSLTPIPSSSSEYPWFDSILDKYVGDQELVSITAEEEADYEPCLRPNASTLAALLSLESVTFHQSPADFCDGSFGAPGDDLSTSELDMVCLSFERTEDTPVYKAIVTSESQETPREPFEELWQCARVSAFIEKVTHPKPGPRPCGRALEVPSDKARTQVDASVSAYEMAELLDLYAPEPMSVPTPPSPLKGALFSDGDEEHYRTPATIKLTGAGPHPNERLGAAAREAFWQMWTRPSDGDLALLYKCRDDAPSGLNIFVEEGDLARPLPSNGDLRSSFQSLDRPVGVRERLRLEHLDAFLAYWKESLELDNL